MRELRAVGLLALALLVAPAASSAQPLTILDVPFIAQSELLCGGAAAAMVMRYWGERGIDAESFESLVDRKAGGIRTNELAGALRSRDWNALPIDGSADALDRELRNGRPVIALVEDHPHANHYVVVVARNAGGVVFHDPARAPFRVASAADFDKRWSVTGRWMLVVTPPASSKTPQPEPLSSEPLTTCDQQIADGVGLAQKGDVDAAERTLVAALSCPGDAAFRELAGLRVVQRRWSDAVDLASAAVARDPSDEYAWRLLATARFVTDDALGALDAWNEVREPRIDLIQVNGLTRTRFAVVQHLIGLETGETLTRPGLLRARRRLNELPVGTGAVGFAPLSSGLAEIRATVTERPLIPRRWFDIGVLGLATAVTREIATGVSSPTGGGEQFAVDWRFWAHRPLYQAAVAAPAPWGGTWKLGVSRERQPYTAVFAATVHDSLAVDLADWASGKVRWQFGAGLDRWNDGRTFESAGGGIRLLTGGDRVDARAQLRTWFGGGSSFRRGEIRVVARSSVRRRGTVVVLDGGVGLASSSAPADLWFTGDTGRARPLLLRAHPILTEGERFRTERLARALVHETTEVQRWWTPGAFQAGVAAFVDSGHAARRLVGGPLTDVDIGLGLRAAYPGHGGIIRLDLARGARDGRTAVSVTYTSVIE